MIKILEYLGKVSDWISTCFITVYNAQSYVLNRWGKGYVENFIEYKLIPYALKIDLKMYKYVVLYFYRIPFLIVPIMLFIDTCIYHERYFFITVIPLLIYH